MPLDSDDFKNVLDNMPCDGPETWDDDDQVQKAYKAAGLKRYRLDYVDALSSKNKKTSNKEAIDSSTYGTKGLPSGTSADGPDVKLEVAILAVLQADAKVIFSADVKLNGLLKNFKTLKAEIENMRSPVGGIANFLWFDWCSNPLPTFA